METLLRYLKILGIGIVGLIALVALIIAAKLTFRLIDQYSLFFCAVFGISASVLFGVTIGDRHYGEQKTAYLDYPLSITIVLFSVFGANHVSDQGRILFLPIFVVAIVAGFILAKMGDTKKYITAPRAITNTPITPK